MEVSYPPRIYEKSVAAIYGGGDQGVGVVVEARGRQSGDLCTYTVRLESSDGAFAGEDAVTVTFNGELARDVIADALRWAADRLDTFGRSDGGSAAPRLSDPARSAHPAGKARAVPEVAGDPTGGAR